MLSVTDHYYLKHDPHSHASGDLLMDIDQKENISTPTKAAEHYVESSCQSTTSPALSASSAALSLTKNPALLKTLLATMVDGVIVIDNKGMVHSLNAAGERLFGYTEAEVLGKNIKMLMPQRYSKEHDGYISNYMNTGHKKIIGIGREVAAQRKDGSVFPMELAVSNLPLGNERYFAGIIRDISDRKHVEIELQNTLQKLESRVAERTQALQKELGERLKAEERASKQQTQLAHVLRVNTLWEMGTTLAHELNQPLTVIMTYLQGLIGHAEIGEIDQLELTNTLNRILKHAQQATDIVSHYRAFVKNEPDRSVFRIKGMVEDTLEMVNQELNKQGIKVTLNISEEQTCIEADRVQIQQVLINIIRNSIDAIKEKISHISNHFISIVVEINQSNVHFHIDDNGVGFVRLENENEEESNHDAFRAFNTTKKAGLGMGLAISKSIIEAHAGTIWIDRQVTSGARVSFMLPLNQSNSIFEKEYS